MKPLRRRPLAERTELGLAKLVNLLVGVLAIVFACCIESILDILIYSYNFWAPIIVVPLAAVLLGLRATKAAFLAGTLAGVAGVLVWNYALRQPGGVDGLVVGALTNLAAFALTAALGGPRASQARDPRATR